MDDEFVEGVCHPRLLGEQALVLVVEFLLVGGHVRTEQPMPTRVAVAGLGPAFGFPLGRRSRDVSGGGRSSRRFILIISGGRAGVIIRALGYLTLLLFRARLLASLACLEVKTAVRFPLETRLAAALARPCVDSPAPVDLERHQFLLPHTNRFFGECDPPLSQQAWQGSKLPSTGSP